MLHLFREQPRAFYMIFMLEIWERFGFYTVQGILVLYFIRALNFTTDTAYYTFGAFSALVYGMIALGGYLGDNVLGTKRTLVLGLFVLAVGYLSLTFASGTGVFVALGFICVGNGLFKANPSSLLAKAYSAHDERLHSAFTLYYMAINFGAIVALFAGPALATRYGYSFAYFASFIGIVLGLVNYALQRKHVVNIHTTADHYVLRYWHWGFVVAGIVLFACLSAYLLQHVMLAKRLLWAITIFVCLVYFLRAYKEERMVRLRMILAFILMLEAIVFFTLYQQMPMSLNLFAVYNVHASLFSISFDPQSFQALNALWIVTMSPVVAWFYTYLQRRGVTFRTPYKFALGMTCSGLGFSLLFFARYAYDAQGMIAAGWLIAGYFFQSLGEIFVSALGIAMVAELVPEKMAGFVMGGWFLTSAIAGFTGAAVASYTALPSDIKPGIDSLMIYTQVFGCIGLITLTTALTMWLTAPFLTRLMSDPVVKTG